MVSLFSATISLVHFALATLASLMTWNRISILLLSTFALYFSLCPDYSSPRLFTGLISINSFRCLFKNPFLVSFSPLNIISYPISLVDILYIHIIYDRDLIYEWLLYVVSQRQVLFFKAGYINYSKHQSFIWSITFLWHPLIFPVDLTTT